MNNLKKARKAAGFTQVEIAKLIGISQNGYSYWETGKAKIDNASLAKLAALYGCSTDYLLDITDDATGKVSRIPVLGSVPAGIPLEAIEDVIDWEEIPGSMLAGGREYFALQVKGDSMYPAYLPGDVVIVRRTPDWQTGDVCIVYVNGYDATLKQLHLAEDGSVTLRPLNPNYPPRTFTPQEVAELPVTVAGVVVELRRKVGR